MDRLSGKVAVVMGGGQTPGPTIGNGRATAVLFAREGAQVTVVDRDLDRAGDTVRLIGEEGGTADAIGGDVSTDEGCGAVVEEVVARHGRLDVLHNNVGIGVGDASATRITAEALHHIQQVNLDSVVFACKHALPVMRRQAGGSIVNISSIAAIAPFPGVGYKVTKAAINAYSQSIAVANARYGIRVNVIMPGLIETPMAIESNLESRDITREQLIEDRHRQVPMGHMGEGWDVAWAAVFLASDEARFVTGVALPVDGGQSARVA
ncbi:MAG: SDR family oxidoreductase [Acidimicrobiia bacterium]|nr:SDR family oxidoreductase [Acidimicrobiia bacterium]